MRVLLRIIIALTVLCWAVLLGFGLYGAYWLGWVITRV